MTITIDDFEKRYVNVVSFNDGDKILVTDENIEHLRNALDKTDFHWGSGHHITDMDAPVTVNGKTEPAFGINRVIELHNEWSHTQLLFETDEEDVNDIKDAVNYIFIDY